MMTKEEYEQLGQLLLKLKLDEERRIQANHKGPMYLDFVDRELFAPIRRLMDLAEVRVEQVS